jgi:hypothetical protein
MRSRCRHTTDPIVVDRLTREDIHAIASFCRIARRGKLLGAERLGAGTAVWRAQQWAAALGFRLLAVQSKGLLSRFPVAVGLSIIHCRNQLYWVMAESDSIFVCSSCSAARNTV